MPHTVAQSVDTNYQTFLNAQDRHEHLADRLNNSESENLARNLNQQKISSRKGPAANRYAQDSEATISPPKNVSKLKLSDRAGKQQQPTNVRLKVQKSFVEKPTQNRSGTRQSLNSLDR